MNKAIIAIFLLLLGATNAYWFNQFDKVSWQADRNKGELCVLRETDFLRQKISLGANVNTVINQLDELHYNIDTDSIIKEYNPKEYIGMRDISISSNLQCLSTSTYPSCGFHFFFRDDTLMEISHQTKCG